MLDEILDAKVANADLKSVLKTMLNACGTITEALRKELVTVAEKQASVFGDVQLGVDVAADNLMWDVCKTDPLIKNGASEEEPEVREMHADGKFCTCWDPLDGSSIVDNNWAVGTILGIWPESTGILGATGRDQVASMVALYGPRTTVFVTLDDGVYEFTYGANGVDGWLCSRDRVEIAQESKIFAPANMRAAQDLPEYGKLIDYWMTNRYTSGTRAASSPTFASSSPSARASSPTRRRPSRPPSCASPSRPRRLGCSSRRRVARRPMASLATASSSSRASTSARRCALAARRRSTASTRSSSASKVSAVLTYESLRHSTKRGRTLAFSRPTRGRTDCGRERTRTGRAQN